MQVKSYQAGSVGEVEIDDRPFHDKLGKARVLYRTLKDAVVMHQANQRQGTAKTKNRSAVRGTNKKPYKQKGTGRARAGDVKSPIWRGGGTVFGPLPRDYSYHMPAKARRVAARTAILGKLQDGEVVITDLSGFTAPSTKSAQRVLTDLGSPRRALIVLAEPREMVWKSFRNIPRVTVRTATDLCAFDVVAGGLVIMESAAMDALAQRLGVSLTDAAAGGEGVTTIDRSYRVIQKPVITEKASDDTLTRNAYCFRVPVDANKIEIRQSVERLFDVKVLRVNTLRVRGKWRIRGRSIGRSANWKKAMVVLADGNTIDVL